MENFKISVDVNVKFSEETLKFFASIFNGAKLATTVQSTLDNTQAPATTSTAPAKPAPAAPAKPTSAPAVTATTEAKPSSNADTISIDEVRAAVAAKVTNHRSEIKEKLTELGAPSVTKLDSSKYEEMLNFLNSLE